MRRIKSVNSKTKLNRQLILRIAISLVFQQKCDICRRYRAVSNCNNRVILAVLMTDSFITTLSHALIRKGIAFVELVLGNLGRFENEYTNRNLLHAHHRYIPHAELCGQMCGNVPRSTAREGINWKSTKMYLNVTKCTHAVNITEPVSDTYERRKHAHFKTLLCYTWRSKSRQYFMLLLARRYSCTKLIVGIDCKFQRTLIWRCTERGL